jgi:hypothetical protein
LVNFFKTKLKARLLKKSANPIASGFISQLMSYSFKLIIILISLYILGLNDLIESGNIYGYVRDINI